MNVRILIVDAETGETLKVLSSNCVTDSPSRALQMFADDLMEYQAKYPTVACDLAYDEVN